MSNNYKPVIGLEIHVELNTSSKMFCRCSANYFGAQPNTHTCPVCLGLPGALPVPNKKAIEDCILIGLALDCSITESSYFERKNYFYPDLPKGFQISQYKEPFGTNGYLEIDIHGKKKKIQIRRVHMEEDTGKIVHQPLNGRRVSLLDFNRSGVPLVEIVTEPDIQTGEEAKVFLTKLQQIIRYLGVSDADMEKGHMRLEPNISLQKENETELPKYKVEVKNINSFKFVEKSINFEIERQRLILDDGKVPVQETRGWDELKNGTVSQRVKEEAHDYRYFPEPDIPPIVLHNKQIEEIKKEIPELPDDKILRFQSDYGINRYNSEILTRERDSADYFEAAVKEGNKVDISPNQIANAIINKKVDIQTTVPGDLIKQIRSYIQNVQNELSDDDINNIEQILEENPRAVEDYKKGKTQVLGFLIGLVNKKFAEKKVNTSLIKEALENLLKD
jgi:aspartyl-tRNA(Asn)/glutamyl-tRNA(Gln) amidotransferase subunit B